MRKRLRVTVLMDPGAIPDEDSEFMGAPEEPTTEYHVVEALRLLGHGVSILGAVDDVRVIVDSLHKQNPDLVFNLTEQLRGDRRHDKNIAGLLEMLGIAFTGSGPAGLMLCRDKALCKQLLSLHKIRVPGFIRLERGRAIHVSKSLQFPLVVKPALEDSSEGISNASLVNNESSLNERAEFIHSRWRQPVIAEEYIEGRELYVGVLGNARLTVLPVRECCFGVGSEDGPVMATYRVKWDHEYRQKWQITFGFAELEPAVLENIQRVCKRVYRVLQIRDYGRIDLRLRPDNKLVVLEANPNPDIAYGEDVAEAAEKAGMTYEDLIDRITRLALRRHKQMHN